VQVHVTAEGPDVGITVGFTALQVTPVGLVIVNPLFVVVSMLALCTAVAPNTSTILPAVVPLTSVHVNGALAKQVLGVFGLKTPK